MTLIKHWTAYRMCLPSCCRANWLPCMMSRAVCVCMIYISLLYSILRTRSFRPTDATESKVDFLTAFVIMTSPESLKNVHHSLNNYHRNGLILNPMPIILFVGDDVPQQDILKLLQSMPAPVRQLTRIIQPYNYLALPESGRSGKSNICRSQCLLQQPIIQALDYYCR